MSLRKISLPDEIFSNRSVEFFFLVVSSQLSKPTGADAKNIRASLTSSGVLGAEGWRGFLRNLLSSEGAAYDLHVARVIHSILLATPRRSGEEPAKTKPTTMDGCTPKTLCFVQSSRSRIPRYVGCCHVRETWRHYS
jgi:hypothetical protein